MVPQSNGKIFLTEERGIIEQELYRSYNTFNFGKYYNRHKTGFGPLAVLNEDTIAGGASMQMEVGSAADIILVPTVGDIEYSDSYGNTSVIQVGQAQLFSASAGSSFSVTNPYKSDMVNFLQLWLQPAIPLAHRGLQLFTFSIDDCRNNLVTIFHHISQLTPQSSVQYVLSIGKFEGRQEALYKLNDPNNGLFVFVIEGVFEVQYRLLHNGDGLALWNIEEAGLEALSNNAVALIMEVPVTGS